ncbi:oligosaccharide biosynthesis protein Alg14 like-domain-containing protein [Massariosphaeria phaeospora]|uniref:UDP-N-acetylglucosamine transferase subunit ALG14 n=1 Tax=Massariosphaeria phaeospora TaxID=100035 RepID=A0A7C8I9H2_9PLEO|nr:oligosaccharide biosynthesis protein Alg14 like-domain-containing protein [Massariosphaeria phaeospora]
MPSPPPLSALYSLSFLLALLTTLLVAASLRLLAILPTTHTSAPLAAARRKHPHATRLLIVLGSGGHTHEMLYLLRALDPAKYTHRTYVVGAGDAFSAQRAVEFEREVEGRERERARARGDGDGDGDIEKRKPKTEMETETQAQRDQPTPPRTLRTGPEAYNIATIPRARHIHQPLLTTPLTALSTLLYSFPPLLSSPPLLPAQPPQTPYEAAAADLPDLILTNGPATGVLVVLAALVLKFFDVRGAQSRGMCKTVYVESFARVRTLSLSGRCLVWVVDRFVVQWEELEGRGGRAEFWGVLV